MFTGLIEAVGEVVRHEAPRLVVRPPTEGMGEPWALGESIAINGCCLTLVDFAKDLAFDLSEETYARTALSHLTPGTPVNLERAMRVGDRLGGHMVQGHVDTVTECIGVAELDGSWRFDFRLPEPRTLLVQKGSVCINGVSLTVADLADAHFSVAIIPYTFAHTTFNRSRPGDRVNIEFDILGKYVQRGLGR